MAKQKPPVITATDPIQFQRVIAFMDQVRRDNTIVARLEVQRLQPYIEAFSKKLRDNLRGVNDPILHALFEKLSTPKSLTKIFEENAGNTGSTVLSEVMIGPQRIFDKENLRQTDTQYAEPTRYGDTSFTMGFMQFKSDDLRSSVSIPVLALDDEMMRLIGKHRPQKMLRALQEIMTAGNHDVLHHYTNRALDPHIANVRIVKGLGMAERLVRSWLLRHFNPNSDNKDRKSFESWLMLTHAGVREIMDQGEEGRKLREACHTFFDELTRIGKEIEKKESAEQSHKVVDYFGTALCFSIMRFQRLDSSLMTTAISRLKLADPTPMKIYDEEEKIRKAMRVNDIFPDSHMTDTIANYEMRGVRIDTPKPDYFDLKRLQLIMLAPWMTSLLSPAQPDTLLYHVQARTDLITRDMLKHVAASVAYSPIDGVQVFRLREGETVEIYSKGGKLCEDKPGIIETCADGTRKQKWFKDGKLCRSVMTTPWGYRHEEFFKDNLLHNDHGPASIQSYNNGLTLCLWAEHGKTIKTDCTTPKILKLPPLPKTEW